MGEDGAPGSRPRHIHFELLQTAYGSHRAHVMPSVGILQDVSNTASLAFLVQYHTRRNELGDPGDPAGRVEVYPEGDPEWVKPEQICPFKDMLDGRLVSYNSVLPSITPGVLVLSDSYVVQQRYALLDAKCPVFALMSHLQERRWQIAKHPIKHTSCDVGLYDGGCGVKSRAYLQCLVTLGSCLALTSSLPSRQPIAYYQLLLRGKKAEPYQAAQVYRKALSDDKRANGEVEFLALQDDGGECLALGDDPDGVVCPGFLSRPDAKVTEAGPAIVAASAASASSASGGPAAMLDVAAVVVPSSVVSGDLPADGGASVSEAIAGPVLDGDADIDGIVSGPAQLVPPAVPPAAVTPHTWLPGLFGSKINYHEYVKSDGTIYPNFTIECNRHGCSCKKTRGRTARNMRRHGEIEPVALLSAWLSVEIPAGKTHPQCTPGNDEVDAIVLAHHDELVRLVALLNPPRVG